MKTQIRFIGLTSVVKKWKKQRMAKMPVFKVPSAKRSFNVWIDQTQSTNDQRPAINKSSQTLKKPLSMFGYIDGFEEVKPRRDESEVDTLPLDGSTVVYHGYMGDFATFYEL
ncbi:hypothetical protein AC249_AIPGENE9372 [Exaiptasia diaphana]|nr:hypothetical protein AC249_AIPGENE9372 [Exaiptasia diaphana]